MSIQDRLAGFSGAVAVKPACVVRSTGNITLSSTQVVDGIAVGTNEERVLVGEQTDPKENGIYIASNSTWIRATDFDGNRDAIPGTFVYVDRGSEYATTFWAFNSSSTDTRIIIETDDITVDQITVALAGVSAFSQTLLGLVSADQWRSTSGIDAQEDVITTQGDLAKGSTLGEAVRLARGSFGSLLLSSAVDIGWLSAGSEEQLLQIRSSAPTWVNYDPPLARGYIYGFILSPSTVDADHDVDIAVGEARSESDTFNIRSTASITKAIDSTWVSGDGGGLDTGTVSSTTWYYAFMISGATSTGNTDAIFSLNSSGPAFPSTDYDEQRIVGAVFTSSTANIELFDQDGDYFTWRTPVDDLGVSSSGSTSATAFTVRVPPGYIVEGNLMTLMDDGGTRRVSFFGYNQTVRDVTAADADLRVSANGTTSEAWVKRLIENGQIRYIASATPVSGINCFVQGWRDPRGKNR